jgi:hypothetical protein
VVFLLKRFVLTYLPFLLFGFICYLALNYLLTYLLTHSLTHPLTHSMVQNNIWKADCHSACQKILLSNGTRRSITVFTKAHHWTLSWAIWIQFAPWIPISLRSIFFQVPILMSFFHCLGRAKESVQVRSALKYFVTIKKCLRWGVTVKRPTPKLKYHPLSAVRDCLFNIFAATLRTRRASLHPQPEDAPCRGDKLFSTKCFKCH